MKSHALLIALVALAGCRADSPQSVAGKAAPARIATNPTMSNGMWTVVKAECKHCHDTRGNHALPADIDLSSKTSLPLSRVQDVADAVRDERAPAFRKIPAASIDTILAWCQDRGADTSAVYVPSSFSWNMTNQIGSDANGTNLEGPGEFFAFAVEDYGRPDSLIVKTYDGIKGMAFWSDNTCNQDSFSSSTHRVTYVVPAGLAWNGRQKTGYIKSWFQVNRWSGVVVHGKQLKKGDSPYDAREPRTYVLAHFDRDWISLRGKLEPADGTETYPWDGADPILTAYSGEALNVEPIRPGNHYGLLNDVRYWFELQFYLESGNMVYDLHVYDDDHDANSSANLLAHVKGYRADDENAWGSFAFRYYSEDSVNGSGAYRWRWFGGTQLYASTVYGSGQRVGGCKKNCQELD